MAHNGPAGLLAAAAPYSRPTCRGLNLNKIQIQIVEAQPAVVGGRNSFPFGT
jgi:hypothetical protein